MTGPNLALQLIALVALVLAVIGLFKARGKGEVVWAVFLMGILWNVDLLRRLFSS